MNEQVSENRPWYRWLWLVVIVAVLTPVLVWGFQTAIEMEEGPADAGAPITPAS